jgi:hypothetical protein
MAEVFRKVRPSGRVIEGAMAELEGVQAVCEAYAFEIFSRAQVNLQEARESRFARENEEFGDQLGHSQITYGQERDREYGHLDWYIALDDRRSDFGAMSIEFGRADYLIDENGVARGGHEGLYILTRAANIDRPRGRRVKPNLRRMKKRAKASKRRRSGSA